MEGLILSEEDDIHTLSKLSIEELRRNYDNEFERHKAINSKAATVLGFVTLIITILNFILKYFFEMQITKNELLIYAILTSSSVIILSISIILLINVFLVKKVSSPFIHKMDKLEEYLMVPSYMLELNLLFDYGRSVQDLCDTNERKAISLKYAIMLLAVGVLISLIPLLIYFWLKVLR